LENPAATKEERREKRAADNHCITHNSLFEYHTIPNIKAQQLIIGCKRKASKR